MEITELLRVDNDVRDPSNHFHREIKQFYCQKSTETLSGFAVRCLNKVLPILYTIADAIGKQTILNISISHGLPSYNVEIHNTSNLGVYVMCMFSRDEVRDAGIIQYRLFGECCSYKEVSTTLSDLNTVHSLVIPWLNLEYKDLDKYVNEIWIMRDGTPIMVKDMSESHLRNAIKMLQRKVRNIEYTDDMDLAEARNLLGEILHERISSLQDSLCF